MAYTSNQILRLKQLYKLYYQTNDTESKWRIKSKIRNLQKNKLGETAPIKDKETDDTWHRQLSSVDKAKKAAGIDAQSFFEEYSKKRKQ